MRRPQRPAVAACRNPRRAATISAWQNLVCAIAAALHSRLPMTTSGQPQTASAGRAGVVRRRISRPRGSGIRPSGCQPSLASRLTALISGSHSSRLAALTFRIRRKLSSVLSSISVALAGSPPCWSSSITIPSPARRPVTGCWKPSAGSFPRTSTRAASNAQCRSGPRKSWSRNCRPGSRLLQK